MIKKYIKGVMEELDIATVLAVALLFFLFILCNTMAILGCDDKDCKCKMELKQ